MTSRAVLGALGVLLVLVGTAVVLSGGLSLPTRSPPVRFRFAGVSLLLLGATPMLAGSIFIAIAVQAIDRRARAVRWLVGAGIALLGLSFVLAPKA